MAEARVQHADEVVIDCVAFYLGFPQKIFKMPLAIFLLSVKNRRLGRKRMRAFLLSLRMRMVRDHAQTHMVKNGGFMSSLKGSTNTIISSPLKPHTNAHTRRLR